VKLPLANGKYRKPAIVLANGLCVAALAAWLFHLYIFFQYDDTRPRVPDKSIGRVYPQNNHGHVVYLTKEEDHRLTKLTITAFGLFCFGALVGHLFVEEMSWKRKQPWEKKQW